MEISGKIEWEGFNGIIKPRCGFPRKEVMTGPAFGTDVSVADLGNGLGLAITSDPLSLIPSLGLEESAWLSVHLMANDMATTGFSPMYAQMVLNLPVGLSAQDFTIYWDYVHRFCYEIGVSITGGHTGSVPGQESTIAGGGTMLLTAPLDRIRTSRKARPGQAILLTKEAAMSSAAILAMSFPETVRKRAGKETWEKACGLFYRTSSLPDGLAAAQFPAVTAMHDVTEGGVLGAVYEMAVASGLGVRIFDEQLPVGEAQKEVCALFGLDPRFCIGAGAMVLAADEAFVPDIINGLKEKGIAASAIGVFTPAEEGCVLVEQGTENPLPYYGKDPYWEAFFKAYAAGWK